MPGQAGKQSAYKEKPVSTFPFGKNLSTQRTDTVGSTFFNLGIFSAMNRLNGLGVNVLGAVTGKDMNEFKSRYINMVGGSIRGGTGSRHPVISTAITSARSVRFRSYGHHGYHA